MYSDKKGVKDWIDKSARVATTEERRARNRDAQVLLEIVRSGEAIPKKFSSKRCKKVAPQPSTSVRKI